MDIERFFKALFPETEGYVQIKAIKNGEVSQYWYEASDIRRLVHHLRDGEEGGLPVHDRDIFFGVYPRARREKGDEQAIEKVNCLYVDLDCYNSQEKKQKLALLKGFSPTPSVIVSSGHGYHVYWLLARPHTIQNRNDALFVKALNKGVAEKLGGDKVFDLARVLRIPGTKNFKDPAKPLLVEIVKLEPNTRHEVAQFEAFRTEVEELKQKVKIQPAKIPDRFWRILKGDPKLRATWQGKRNDLHDRTRSGYDMALANLLMPYEFTDSEIAAILRASPSGKGKDARMEYLTLTISKARNSWSKRKPITLNDVKEVFSRWLYLPNTNLIDVVMATVLANRVRQADPLWVFLVAPPSGTKTEILRTLQECENVYHLSSLTPHTFVSGKMQTGQQETSLLLRIKEGILVMKDFGSILEMRPDDRGEILAQLREIADGKYDKRFGTGKIVHWEGKLGFLAGATPIIDEYLLVKQVLGERFITYRIPHEDKRGLAIKAMNNLSKEKEMKKELSGITKQFLSQFGNDIKLPECKDEVKMAIVSLAVLIAQARSTVPRARFGDRMIKYVPEAEIPARLSKQLYLLVSGLTLALG